MILARGTLRTIASLALVALPATAAAEPSAIRESLPRDFRAKKDRRLDAKAAAEAATDDQARTQWEAHLDKIVGKKPAPVINIFTLWNHEYLVVDFKRHGDGPEIPEKRGERFLRCHFTNEPTHMDPRLFEMLVKAARRFRAHRINIVSGFRSPKYNLMLRKKGHQVARVSQHTLGKAVDFRIPGVPIRRLHRWARSLKLGGVGFYPSSRFIHVDTGRVRYWHGR